MLNAAVIMVKLCLNALVSRSVLTQRVGLAILVGDGEDSYDGVAILPQLLVNLLAEQTLTNHCDLHPHASTVEHTAI